MSERDRLQLRLDPTILAEWIEKARLDGIPVSHWVTQRVNRPDCVLSLDDRMDRLIEILERKSIDTE